jgi:hypothetical protein
VEARDVTEKSAFSNGEWYLLVRLPRWVALAASAAEADSPLRTAAEKDAGLIAIANGRRSGNRLVSTVAHQLLDEFDEPDAAGERIDFKKATAGVAAVLDRARTAATLLAEKADPADAAAYRQWLLSITDTVVGVARSGAFQAGVSAAERRFRDNLAQTLGG